MSPSKADRRIDGILAGTKQILDIAKDLLSFCPIPGLPAAASTLSSLIDMILKVRGNEETRRDLAKKLKDLALIIERTVKQANSVPEIDDKARRRLATSPELEKRMLTLNSDLEDLTSEAEQLEEGLFFGFLLSRKNAETLLKIRAGIEDATRKFLIEGEITIELLVNSIINSQLQELDEKALEKLPHVNAGYTSVLNPTTSGTLEGTRTALLEEITEWTLRPDSNKSSSFIYVLSGGAGTGKSTIAFEMAQRLEKAGALGASFFFVSGADKLNTTTYVMTTIAYQLARNQKDLYPHIAKAAREYLKKGKQGEQLRIDLHNLIIKPLMNIHASHHPVIILLDALDECTKAAQDEVVRLLYLFMEQLTELPFPLRVLATTRPEMHFEAAFNTEKLRKVSKPYKLHEIPRSIVDVDIKRFLETKLRDLSYYDTILSARPNVIQDLTKLSAGLFIYADTIIKFLGKNPHYAAKIIVALLSDNPSDAAFSLKNLDRLYIAVLQNALDDDSLDIPRMKEYIQVVLGSLALLQDHVSTLLLHDLIGVPMGVIRDLMSRLGSVVLKPERDDFEIRMLHASFPQFLIDNNRCNSPIFYINPSLHHRRLASICLHSMISKYPLKRNICDLDDPTIMKLKIPGLTDRVEEFIPASIKYSCIHWATHLTQCNNPGRDISELVVKFAKTKLMAWLEVLSYMDMLQVAVPALLAAFAWCQDNIHDEHKNEILGLMYDAYRLVLQFYTPIDECPEHLYISGLRLAPSCILTTHYNCDNMLTNNHTSIRLMTTRDSAWGSCLHTIPMDAKNCRAVLSPNGGLIASGSSDGKICIWDANIGLLKRTLYGHLSSVKCLAWTPDGESLASGSTDGTFRIWNATSGAQVHVQDVQNRKCEVSAIAWSQEGTHVVTGLKYGGVQTWNVVIGEKVKVAMTALTIQTVLAISKDASRVVDITVEGEFRLWDIKCDNGRVLKELKAPLNIYTAVFLNKNTQVAFCGEDKAIYVWDLESGNCTRKVELQSKVTFKGNTVIFGIALSQDENILASSTLDRINFFDSKTWDSLGSFHGFFYLTASFSPDARSLLSSYNTLQMWDISPVLSSKLQPISAASPTSSSAIKHDSPIYFVTISLDGSRVAAVSRETVSIWSLQSGTLFCIIHGVFAGSAYFSPDARNIAIAENRKTCIYDIATAEPALVHIISSGNEFNDRIAWSPNGHWIVGAAYSSDTIRGLGVFDAASGKLEKYIPLNNQGTLWDIEFSQDSTMLYVGWGVPDEAIFRWREGEQVDVQQHMWETEVVRRGRSYEDRWILSERDGKRLCWAQEGNRQNLARWGSYYVVGRDSGLLDILHIEEEVV